MWNRKNKEDAPGSEAERADELFRKGKKEKALLLLGRTAARQADPQALPVARRWIAKADFARGADEKAICSFAAFLVRPIDGCSAEIKKEMQENLLRILRGLDPASCAARDDVTDYYAVTCMLLRHMGRAQEALEAARKGLEAHHSPYCATFAGACCMDLDDAEQAEKYTRLGVELNGGNAAGYNDLGDYFYKKGAYRDAMRCYDLVLQSSEDHDAADLSWAETTFLFCRYLLEQDDFDLERLAAFAAAEPDNGRIQWLCGQARRMRMTPYVDYIPESSESVINAYRGALSNGKAMQNLRMAQSCQESASAINALRLGMSDYGKREAKLELHVNEGAQPPLDTAVIPEGIRLWRYDSGFNAAPAVEPPPKKIALLVQRLAGGPFQLGSWYERAGELAQELSAADACNVAACMVYPPRPMEKDVTPWQWLMRVQYAAVCLLARIPTGEESGESGAMKRIRERLPSPALARICLGQLDWPVIPALTLAAWQAKQGLADAQAVYDEIFAPLCARVTKNSYCFFEHALVCALTWLPGGSEEAYSRMRERRKLLEQE